MSTSKNTRSSSRLATCQRINYDDMAQGRVPASQKKNMHISPTNDKHMSTNTTNSNSPPKNNKSYKKSRTNLVEEKYESHENHKNIAPKVEPPVILTSSETKEHTGQSQVLKQPTSSNDEIFASTLLTIPHSLSTLLVTYQSDWTSLLKQVATDLSWFTDESGTYFLYCQSGDSEKVEKVKIRLAQLVDDCREKDSGTRNNSTGTSESLSITETFIEEDLDESEATAHCNTIKAADKDCPVKPRPMSRFTHIPKKVSVTLPKEFTRSYKCEFCGYCSTRNGLVMHMRRHHKTKCYSCSFCSLKFSQLCDMKSHAKTHCKEENGNTAETETLLVGSCNGNIPDSNNTKQQSRRSEDFNSNAKKENIDASSVIIKLEKNEHEEGVSETDDSKTTQTFESSEPSKVVILHRNSSFMHKNPDLASETCPECNFRSTKAGIQSHLTRHHSRHAFTCEICQKVVLSRYIFQKHRATHFDSNGKLNKWVQKKCGMLHKDQKPDNYPCSQCDRVFASLRSLNCHLRGHQKREKNEGPKMHLCEFCSYRSKRKTDLEKHIARRHSETQHACSDCGKTYSFTHDLAVHMITQHSNQAQSICSVCKKPFAHPRYLKAHMLRHEKSFRFKCNCCDKGFMDKKRWQQHMETHLPVGDRTPAGQCNVCGKSFLNARYLAQHKNIHTDTRPYKCSECDLAFHTFVNMYKHTRTHKVPRPQPAQREKWRCTVPNCQQVLPSGRLLQLHLQSEHDMTKPFSCQTCDRHFSSVSGLKTHRCVPPTMNKAEYVHITDPAGGASRLVTLSKPATGHNLASGDMQNVTTQSDPILMQESGTTYYLINSTTATSVPQGDGVIECPSDIVKTELLDKAGANTCSVSRDSRAQLLVDSNQTDLGDRNQVVLEESEKVLLDTEETCVQEPNSHAVTILEDDKNHQKAPPTESGEECSGERAAPEEGEQEELYMCSVCQELLSSWPDVQTHMLGHSALDVETEAPLQPVTMEITEVSTKYVDVHIE